MFVIPGLEWAAGLAIVYHWSAVFLILYIRPVYQFFSKALALEGTKMLPAGLTVASSLLCFFFLREYLAVMALDQRSHILGGPV